MNIVIIGGDAAGMSAAMQIKRKNPDWQITVFEKGLYTSYGACGIPYVFSGDVEKIDDLVVVTPEQFRKKGIDVREGWEVTNIDVNKKFVTAVNNDNTVSVEYDKLLYAAGAKSIIPDWPGVELEGVLTIKNLTDAQKLDSLLKNGPKNIVVIGAGYIGLEIAESLAGKGAKITVLEKLPGVMGNISSKINAMVAQEFAENGIEFKSEVTVSGFKGDEKVTAVLSDQGEFPADLVIVSLGVKPNTELAKNAGIALGESGAIKVNSKQETEVPDVYAAGDCCEAYHRVLGKASYIPLALTANRQGRVAGMNMSGENESFGGIVGSAVTRVFDLVIARTGIDDKVAQKEAIPCSFVEAEAPSKAHYYLGHKNVYIKLFYNPENHKVLGAFLAGKDQSLAKRSDVIATAITAGMTVPELSELDLSYAPPFAPVWDPVLQAANKAKFKL